MITVSDYENGDESVTVIDSETGDSVAVPVAEIQMLVYRLMAEWQVIFDKEEN